MDRFSTSASASLLIVLAFAGCLASDATEPQETRDPPRRLGDGARDPTSSEFKPHVVVAVIDSGVNVYHSEFAERYDAADPATYIPGYPETVIPLKLSPFNSSQGLNRERLDAELWGATKPQVLYRVEGTKVVGLISFGASLPGGGHGTMTSSRAVGNNVSTGGPAIRLVHVVGIGAASITWAADQPWIDIISISAGISGVNPVVGNVQDSAGMKAQNAAAKKKPFFASSGNGLGNAGLLGFPVWLRGASGVPDVISVGANDNGRMAVWHNYHSYIMGDGCGNPRAADNNAKDIVNTGGGTSSATPFSAGSGAKLLLEARRLLGDAHVGMRYSPTAIPSFNSWSSGNPDDAKVILAQGNASLNGITTGPLADGVFTLQEFKNVVYHTAISGGSDDPSDGSDCMGGPGGGTVPGDDVPHDVRAQFGGYGEVNGKSTLAAIEVINGNATIPSRPADDAWYQRFYTFRTATMPQ